MKTVLITGATRGIGLAHAKRFAARGAMVYATAREPADAKELTGLGERVKVLAYDAKDPDAASKLKRDVGSVPLDLLFANAGVIGGRHGFGSTDAAAMIETFAVNSVAPLKLAETFADNVAASERKLIAFQSSRMGSIDDNGSGGYYAYRLSKAALNMVARGVAVDLRGRGVTAVALHPGWVKTRMGGESATLGTDDCAEAQQRLFDKLTLDQSGRFFNYDGKEIPW